MSNLYFVLTEAGLSFMKFEAMGCDSLRHTATSIKLGDILFFFETKFHSLKILEHVGMYKLELSHIALLTPLCRGFTRK